MTSAAAGDPALVPRAPADTQDVPLPPPTAGPDVATLVTSVYLPAWLFAVGQGAVTPLIALAARDAGASLAVAGVVVAVRGIGTTAFDVPAGKLVGRWGERRSIAAATLALLAAGAGCIVARTPLQLAVAVFVMGCAWSVWLLARLSFVSDSVPVDMRGRALSTLGGVNRAGNFVGPFAGAVVVAAGGLDAAFVLQGVAASAGCLLLMRSTELGSSSTEHRPPRIRTIARDHARTLSTAGVAASCISLLRTSRQVILPLWGAHLGLDASQIALVFGLSSGLDLLLFYPSGVVSDRIGRKVVAIPCAVVLSLGLLLVPLTDDPATFVAVALLLGAGNGMGTGIVMILGADLSPSPGRAEFLGVWRLVTDVGQASGPLAISAIAATASLGVASSTMGTVGLVGAAYLARFVPETLERGRS